MLRRGQRTTFEDRLDIAERAAAGQHDSEIAAALACSVWTVAQMASEGPTAWTPGLDLPDGPTCNRPVER